MLALASFASQFASDENAIEALYALGHSLFTQERFADAASVFRIMLQVAPTDDRSWLALGECHRNAGHEDLALELFAAGTVAANTPKGCALARFRMLHDQGRDLEADAAFDEALELAEGDADDAYREQLINERNARP